MPVPPAALPSVAKLKAPLPPCCKRGVCGLIRIGTAFSLTLLAVAGIVLADPSKDAQAFLTVRGAESILPPPGGMEKLWDARDLEPELRSLLARNIMGRPVSVGDEAAFEELESYHGFSWDLQGNGGKHHFVHDPVAGGSGGYAFVIVSQDDGTWRAVGKVQAASVQLDRNESGEPVLVVFGRGGGDNYARDDHEFVRGAWRVVRSSRFENGKISEVALRPGASGILPDPPLEREARPARRGHPLADRAGPGVLAEGAETKTPAERTGTAAVGRVDASWLLVAGLIVLVGWLLRRTLRARESG